MKIDLKLLNQFPEFRAFRTSQPNEIQETVAAPQERIDTAFAELRDTLVSELLAKLAVVNPFRFEGSFSTYS